MTAAATQAATVAIAKPESAKENARARVIVPVQAAAIVMTVRTTMWVMIMAAATMTDPLAVSWSFRERAFGAMAR